MGEASCRRPSRSFSPLLGPYVWEDLVEQSVNGVTSRLEALRRSVGEQKMELEQLSKGCASSDRQLEELLKHLETRMERHATSAECSEGLQEVRAFARELLEKGSAMWQRQLEALQVEVKEVVEKRASEQLLRLEMEQKQRLEGLRGCSEQLLEAKRELFQELERCQSTDRRLQESVGEAKTSARQTVEEQAQAR